MKSNKYYFIMAAVILVCAIFLTNFQGITGKATVYSKGSGSYYGGNWDDGYRVQLTPGDTAVRTGQYALVKGTKLLDKIVNRYQMSTPQVRAWTGIAAKLNEMIYDRTFKCVRDSSSDQLFVGVKYRIEDSWYWGWKVIYLDGYCHEFKGGQWKKLGKDPVELGYYYWNPSTNEVKL